LIFTAKFLSKSFVNAFKASGRFLFQKYELIIYDCNGEKETVKIG